MFSNFSSTEDFFSKDYWRESPVQMFCMHFVFGNYSEKQNFTPTCTSILKYWVSAPWVTFPLPCCHKHQFLTSCYNKTFLYFLKYFRCLWSLCPIPLIPFHMQCECCSLCLNLFQLVCMPIPEWFLSEDVFIQSMRSSWKLLISLA